jgi:anionic cell wall polymer biosynthesis LytR-Cps2A-Psr (LCP) family protein
MWIRTRSLAAVSATALVLAACTPAATDEPPTTTAPSATSSSSTEAPTTTEQAETTTTTEEPLAVVSVSGEMPSDLSQAASMFMSVIQDPRNDAGDIDPALVEHLAAASGELDDAYSAVATTQELSTGGSVGVVTLSSGDLLLLAEEGNGWTVVGADLSSPDIEPWFGTSPLRVLVLGSDARPGAAAGVSRMDSIHIVTAVPEQQAGTILGFPRDSWVSTQYGDMRINALTASRRGPDAIYSFFTEDWEIPLDGYILTAFSGFERLIGATIGRLLIDLPRSVPSRLYWPGFSAGEQRLSPTRTLELARTRKGVPGGDFTRSMNQGLIMLATLTMLQQGTVQDVPLLLGELVEYTETNLTPTDLIRLGAAAFVLDVGTIDNVVLPGKLGRATGGASVVFLDPEAEDIIADVVDDGLLTPPDE